MQLILSLIAIATVLLGYWIASKVPEEMRIAKPWFLIAGALSACALFFVLPWWQAAIIVGTALIGWIPAIIGVAWASTHPGAATMQIAILLALLIGSRWKAEGWQKNYLFYSSAIIAIVTAVIGLI